MLSETSQTARGEPGLIQALLPLVGLMLLLLAAVAVFGDDATGGPVQVALIAAGSLAGLVGIRSDVRWSELERSVSSFCGMVMIPILLLLTIGALIGIWIAAGVIPSLVVYGSGLLHPSIFYAAALVLCAVIAVASGSAWTTVATIGVALIGISEASGFSLPATAGAIISGVYFGDKLSPLSDTTNLASSMVGANLFVHVKYLLWTTLPAFMIALIFFLVFSIASAGQVNEADLMALTSELQGHFRIGWHLLLPMVGLIGLAVMRVPPLAAIIFSILAGMVFGLVFQSDPSMPILTRLVGYWSVLATGYEPEGGSAAMRDLLSRGGMSSMLTTVWLILSAMFFSGMMDRSGCLARIVSLMTRAMRKDRSIFLGAGATAFVGNAVAADQYLSIVLSTRMYAEEVRLRGFKPEMLSRTAEDFGTVTSALVPWNTCGAFMSATLGVATLSYLPFCIFNLMSPLIACAYIFTGVAVRRTTSAQPADFVR